MVGDDRPALGLLVDLVDGVTTGARQSHTPFQRGAVSLLLDGIIRGERGEDVLLMNPAELAAVVASSQSAPGAYES
jgi:hypothetical protein